MRMAELIVTLSSCRANCYLRCKIIIDFQKRCFTVNFGGPLDRHFRYIVDLTEKLANKKFLSFK